MNLKRTFGKIKLDVRKAAPGAMVAAGIGFGVAAIVEFCRKSRKAAPVIDDYKETVAELIESNRITNDDKSFHKDLATETVKTGVELAKIYAIPIALYAVSVGLNIKSYKVMKKRNVALMAAYAGIGNELRGIYSRISEKYGEDALDELKHGIKKVEVEETRIDEKTGSEVVEKKLIPVVEQDADNPNGYSPYARFFDEASRAWRDDAEYNLVYLLERQEEANQRLKEQGFLFLNDVYEMLDIKKSQAGCKVGWKYYPNGNNPYGDNKITFGIHNVHRAANRDFVNGYEKVILLDFNVDGEIIDTLPRI